MSSLLAERLRLIVITDERVPWPQQRPRLAAALAAGAPAVQLRDKTSSTRTLVERACELRALTAAHGALLFVNDRLDVALAAGADGVHLGDDDLPLEAARRWAPPGFLIGRSADTLAQAQEAAAASADYVGVGPRSPRRPSPMPAPCWTSPGWGPWRAPCPCRWWRSAGWNQRTPPPCSPPAWPGWPWSAALSGRRTRPRSSALFWPLRLPFHLHRPTKLVLEDETMQRLPVHPRRPRRPR